MRPKGVLVMEKSSLFVCRVSRLWMVPLTALALCALRDLLFGS